MNARHGALLSLVRGSKPLFLGGFFLIIIIISESRSTAQTVKIHFKTGRTSRVETSLLTTLLPILQI